MEIQDIVRLAISIAIPLAAGGIGFLFTRRSISDWYKLLKKPGFNPPSWVFGPVWTLLYILMGIALYMIWTEGISRNAVQVAIIFFAVQLALNIAWPFLFFYLRSPAYGFAGIVFLWLSVFATITAFYTVSRTAAYLFLPYILWVTYACVLNYTIWKMNRE